MFAALGPILGALGGSAAAGGSGLMSALGGLGGATMGGLGQLFPILGSGAMSLDDLLGPANLLLSGGGIASGLTGKALSGLEGLGGLAGSAAGELKNVLGGVADALGANSSHLHLDSLASGAKEANPAASITPINSTSAENRISSMGKESMAKGLADSNSLAKQAMSGGETMPLNAGAGAGAGAGEKSGFLDSALKAIKDHHTQLAYMLGGLGQAIGGNSVGGNVAGFSTGMARDQLYAQKQKEQQQQLVAALQAMGM